MDFSNQFGLFAVLFMLFWFMSQLIVGLFIKVLERYSIFNHERLLWVLASIPIALPTTVLVALWLVGWAKHHGWLDQHCDGRYGVLFCHQEIMTQEPGFSAFWLGFGGLLLAFILISAISKLIHSHIKAKSLLRLVQSKGAKRLVKLPESQAYAFVLGVRQPVILWSNQLEKCLSKYQQRMVLAHEIQHIRRQDILKNIIFELLLAFHLSPKTLRRYWQLNMELQVDEQLSNRFNRIAMAELLLKLRRESLTPQPGLAFTGSVLQKRIERLIYPHRQSKLNIEWFVWSLLVLVLLFTGIEHHSVEWLIAWIGL